MHNLKERIRETTAFQLHFEDTTTNNNINNLFVEMQINLFKCINVLF